MRIFPYLWAQKNQMEIYHTLPVETFVKGWHANDTGVSFSLPAIHLMYAAPPAQYEYGLSLLRKAIGLYEEKKGISPERSKRDMPFFRTNSRMLVGPEVELYILPLYENRPFHAAPGLSGAKAAPAGEAKISKDGGFSGFGPSAAFSSDNTGRPWITLKMEAEKVASHCLSENMFFLRCKYEEEAAVQTFATQLEQEYDKFFYDEEHSGFTADSRFFSMLCNAVLEIGLPAYADQKEWRLAVFKSPEEVAYQYTNGKLLPYFEVSLPINSILQIHLNDYETDPLLYGAFAGFLKSKGLSPQQYLDGMQD